MSFLAQDEAVATGNVASESVRGVGLGTPAENVVGFHGPAYHIEYKVRESMI